MTRDEAIVILRKYTPQHDLTRALDGLLKDAQNQAAVHRDIAHLARAAVFEYQKGNDQTREWPAWDALVEAVRQNP